MITIVLLLSHLLCLWKNISILNRYCVIWSVGLFLGPILPMKKIDFFLAVVQFYACWLCKGDVKANLALIQQDQHHLYLTHMQNLGSWIHSMVYYTYPPAHNFFFFDNYWHAYLVLVIHIYTHNSRFLLLHRKIIALGMFIGIICSLLLL